MYYMWCDVLQVLAWLQMRKQGNEERIDTERSNWVLESGGLGSQMGKLPHPRSSVLYDIELNMEL